MSPQAAEASGYQPSAQARAGPYFLRTIIMYVVRKGGNRNIERIQHDMEDVYLPFSVDHEGVEATYESGILQVRLPRAAVTRISIGNNGR
jgi:hypothetical protein